MVCIINMPSSGRVGMRRSVRNQFEIRMCVLHVLRESTHENRIDLARKIGLNYNTGDVIFDDMMANGLILIVNGVNKKGANYCISSLGVETYKLAVEAYENAGMILVK